MSWFTTAEDCKALIKHYEDVDKRFLKKSRRKIMIISERMSYIGNRQWVKKRIQYYTEKLERLERLEF